MASTSSSVRSQSPRQSSSVIMSAPSARWRGLLDHLCEEPSLDCWIHSAQPGPAELRWIKDSASHQDFYPGHESLTACHSRHERIINRCECSFRALSRSTSVCRIAPWRQAPRDYLRGSRLQASRERL